MFGTLLRLLEGYDPVALEIPTPTHSTFAYSQATDGPTFTPNSKLSYGGHTVEEKATDGANQSANKIRGFKVLR